MRAAAAAVVQQTLTAEAAAVLRQAVAEAGKRGHAQATPLHVAATLLGSPSSPLRRACLRTHPQTNHLPQCRALELCLSIALERLQQSNPNPNPNPNPYPNSTSPNSASPNSTSPRSANSTTPSYSNALIAALKRAQAHQRRGFPPDHPQQPLLAVKVELQQLVISILDDPSVSRVMREAGFCSTDVKSHLEEMAGLAHHHQQLSPTDSSLHHRLRHSTPPPPPPPPPPAAAAATTPIPLPLPLRPPSPPPQHLPHLQHPNLHLRHGIGVRMDPIPSPFRFGHQPILAGGGEKPAQLQLGHQPILAGGGENPAQLPLPAASKQQQQQQQRSSAFGGGFSMLPISRDRSFHPPTLQKSSSHSPYLNPMLAKPSPDNNLLLAGGGIAPGGDHVKLVVDALQRRTRRNPLLLADSLGRAEAALRETSQFLENQGHQLPEHLRGVELLPANLSVMTLMNSSKDDLQRLFRELHESVREIRGGVIVNLGDLQWLLQSAMAGPLSGFCPVQYAVFEIRELLSAHRSGDRRVWLMGMTTHQTYQSIQLLHPALECQWDLQNVPVSAAAAAAAAAARMMPAMSFRYGISQEKQPDALLTLSLHSSSRSGDDEPKQMQLACCPECKRKYEKEAALLQEQEGNGESESPQSCNSSVEVCNKAGWIDESTRRAEISSVATGGANLPLWLQKALPSALSKGSPVSAEPKAEAVSLPRRLQELQKKWSQTCRTLHPDGGGSGMSVSQHASPSSSQVSFIQPSLECRADERGRGAVQGSGTYHHHHHHHHHHNHNHHDRDRVLWEEEEEGSGGGGPRARGVKPAEQRMMLHRAVASRRIDGKEYKEEEEMESMARICKGLARRLGGRQPGVISAVAAAVVRCRAGMGKRRRQQQQQMGGGFDAWLLLLGHDRVGKRRMAEALSELLFGEGRKPLRLSFAAPDDAAHADADADADAGFHAGGDADFHAGLAEEDDVDVDDDLPSRWALGTRSSSRFQRRRMPLDVLADSVRRSPSAVVLLEDVELAGSVLRSRLRLALARGRLADSSGRDVSLANAVLLLASGVGSHRLPASVTAEKSSRSDADALANADADADALADADADADADATPPRIAAAAIEEKTKMATMSPYKRRCETGHAGGGGGKRRPYVGRTLGLDLNLSAAEEENDGDGDDVDRGDGDGDDGGSFGPMPSFTGSVKPAVAGEADILSAARRCLHEFFDLVDAVVVFSTTTTTTTTTTSPL